MGQNPMFFFFFFVVFEALLVDLEICSFCCFRSFNNGFSSVFNSPFGDDHDFVCVFSVILIAVLKP